MNPEPEDLPPGDAEELSALMSLFVCVSSLQTNINNQIAPLIVSLIGGLIIIRPA